MNKKTAELYDSFSKSQKKLIKKKVDEQMKRKGKVGSGFFDKLVKGVSKVSKNLPTVRKAVVSIGNKVVKKTEPRNPEWEYDPPANEKLHQIFKTPSGLYNAKWSGPGDKVVPKVNKLWKEHDGNISAMIDPKNFASPADRYAFLHDLLYTLSGDEKDKSKRNKLIRDADKHLVKRLTELKNSGGKNASIPLNLIKLKMKAEDKGAPVYAGDEQIPDQKTRDRLNNIKEHLQMSGAGKNRPKRPSSGFQETFHLNDDLSMNNPSSGNGKQKNPKKTNPWSLHLGDFWAKNKGKMSYKEAMIEASHTYKK